MATAREHVSPVSATSTRTAATIEVKSPTKPKPSNGRSILDEVEGTLSATNTELQDLSAHWQGHGPSLLEIHPSIRDQAKTSSCLIHPTNRAVLLQTGQQPRALFRRSNPARLSIPTTYLLPPFFTSSSSSTPAILQALKTAYDTRKLLPESLATGNETLKTQLGVAHR
jgi:hypothetical protein